ncbi:hypothetical protein [Lewinella sp. IMCC34191]|uniref:hypothetical protein n=1 Tax=Lewinella sp. IMCC34191 TaxID=2259172 RepID=UPI000E27FFBD|nr:hypothetical protein [Lewinella sp. IMCC34191]
MIFRFIAASLLLLFMRGCDIYSTSLWFFQTEGYKDETNPLVGLGMDWNVLLVANVIVVIGVLALYYVHLINRQKVPALPRLQGEYRSTWDFAADLYYGSRKHKYKLLYRLSDDKRIALGHYGVVLLSTIVFASGVATAHNLLSYHRVGFYVDLKGSINNLLYLYYLAFALFAFFSYRSILREDYGLVKLLNSADAWSAGAKTTKG